MSLTLPSVIALSLVAFAFRERAARLGPDCSMIAMRLVREMAEHGASFGMKAGEHDRGPMLDDREGLLRSFEEWLRVGDPFGERV